MEMKTLAAQIANKCIHFSGIMNKCCKAGVPYDSVHDTSTSPHRFACLRDEGADFMPCAKREWPSDEYVSARVRESKESLAKTMTAVVFAKADADEKGLGKGHGGISGIKCPCCEEGTLQYSVASYNGHIHGSCTTPGCVRWME